jgi:hypothetical protein
MMQLAPHRRFVENLLDYLARPGARVWLVGPLGHIEGVYGAKSNGLTRLDALLRRLAHPDLPPTFLSLLALALCAIGVVLAAGSLPRRSPYVRPDLFPKASVAEGFAGRAVLAERQGVNLMWSLLDYKRELEAELSHRLGIEGPFDAREVAVRARKKGWTGEDSGQFAALYERLSGLSLDAEPEKPARIPASELRNVVRQGEELLARLGNDQG